MVETNSIKAFMVHIYPYPQYSKFQPLTFIPPCSRASMPDSERLIMLIEASRVRVRSYSPEQGPTYDM